MNFYHLILLDASGSMDCIRHTALTGCNETIQSIRSTQRKSPDQQHRLTLVSFNSGNVTNRMIDNLPIEQCVDLKERDYIPDSCTPLYDAVGFSIRRLQEQAKSAEGEKMFLVTIITDGLENDSKHFTAKQLKSIIEELKPQGWTFAFIGANQDEVLAANNIGIHNAMSFEQDEAGTRTMFEKLGKARAVFCQAAPRMSKDERDRNFFSNL